MPATINTMTNMCENKSLVELIVWVSTGKPIDFRDVIYALEICIKSGLNAKFIYLFNRFIKQDLPNKLVERLATLTRIHKNRLLIRYLDSYLPVTQN
jgi:hypothetical protein